MAKQPKKTRVELNNAVFSLPDLVAQAEGYFEQEGLDVDLVLPAKRKAMLAGVMHRDEVKTVHVGIPNQRFKALLDGSIQAAAVMEPWISAGEKLGCKVICEAFYNGLEVADPSVDQEIFSALHRAHIRAVDKIRQDIRPWLHHLVAEVPGELVKLEPADLHLPRLRYNYPEPYAPEEFQRTYDFMVDWGLINPASTYDKLVDRRVAL